MSARLLPLTLVAVLAVPLFGAGPAPAEAVVFRSGPLTLVVDREPFAMTFRDADGDTLRSLVAGSEIDPRTPSGPFAFAVGAGVTAHQLGYHVAVTAPLRWFHATDVVAVDGHTFTLATNDPTGRTVRLTVDERAPGILGIEAALSDPSGVLLTGASFRRQADERLLGFGERSDGVDQTGKVVTSWAEEGPFSAGAAQALTGPLLGEDWQGPEPLPGTNFPMPWAVSTRGLGMLLDSTWWNEWRLDEPDRWSVATREPAFRLRIYAGPRPEHVLRRFTQDTGRQPEPAEWFFGPWVQPGPGPEFWREHDTPLTVAQTYTHYLPCAAHDGRRDAESARVQGWHEHGVRVTTYVNSFVCRFHPQDAYEVGDANGYFLKTAFGTTYPVPYVAYVGADAPWHGVVDFTDMDATAWWQGLVDAAIADGYDGWMEDFGEYVPVDAVTSDGRHGLAHHNEYCTLYHRASHEHTQRRVGRDFAQFVRCGYTGTAPYARLVWGADPSEDWSAADGLAAAVSQGLSMGLSGIGYWGSDIGGFHAIQHLERTDTELQARWLQFGAFSGVMRTQRDGYPRPGPYLNERAQMWDDEMLPIWRRYAKLRTQLFPYVWEAAREYQATGMPMMRHLALAYPDDPAIWSDAARFEYLFGDDLLVAPVVEEGARHREVYLPAGRWVPFWEAVDYDEATGAFLPSDASPVLEGGATIRVDAPLTEIPLFVRAGTCLELLPAATFTLTDGLAPDVMDLGDARAATRQLPFDADCD